MLAIGGIVHGMFRFPEFVLSLTLLRSLLLLRVAPVIILALYRSLRPFLQHLGTFSLLCIPELQKVK
jgi:hypothetical protein